jgi:hypothetical protein
LLSSTALRATTNRITSAARLVPSLFCKVTSVPTAYCEKSTTTSNRSAGAITSVSCSTGAPSRPPSLPIWTNLAGPSSANS